MQEIEEIVADLKSRLLKIESQLIQGQGGMQNEFKANEVVDLKRRKKNLQVSISNLEELRNKNLF